MLPERDRSNISGRQRWDYPTGDLTRCFVPCGPPHGVIIYLFPSVISIHRRSCLTSLFSASTTNRALPLRLPPTPGLRPHPCSSPPPPPHHIPYPVRPPPPPPPPRAHVCQETPPRLLRHNSTRTPPPPPSSQRQKQRQRLVCESSIVTNRANIYKSRQIGSGLSNPAGGPTAKRRLLSVSSAFPAPCSLRS